MTVPVSNMYVTWNVGVDAVNTAIGMNVTDGGSAANSKLLDLKVNGVSRFIVYKSGDITANSVVGAQNFTSGNTPPGSARPGDNWFNTDQGVLYIFINDGDSSGWVETGPSGIGAPELKYNLDGGAPGTNFGGITTIDCGGVT